MRLDAYYPKETPMDEDERWILIALEGDLAYVDPPKSWREQTPRRWCAHREPQGIMYVLTAVAKNEVEIVRHQTLTFDDAYNELEKTHNEL